jgi:hypothetical protein
MIFFGSLSLIGIGYIAAIAGGILTIDRHDWRQKIGWFLAIVGVCAGAIGFFLPIAAGEHMLGLSFE